MKDVLREFIGSVLSEGRVKQLGEVDLADGRRVEFGSDDHISDLTERIADMTRYRNHHGRGSAARENYSRTIGRLKTELAKARRVAEKRLSETDRGPKQRKRK